MVLVKYEKPTKNNKMYVSKIIHNSIRRKKDDKQKYTKNTIVPQKILWKNSEDQKKN